MVIHNNLVLLSNIYYLLKASGLAAASQQPSTSRVLAPPTTLASMPAPTGAELPRGGAKSVRLAQLAAIVSVLLAA